MWGRLGKGRSACESRHSIAVRDSRFELVCGGVVSEPSGRIAVVRTGPRAQQRTKHAAPRAYDAPYPDSAMSDVGIVIAK
jgi:hypothetical protein